GLPRLDAEKFNSEAGRGTDPVGTDDAAYFSRNLHRLVGAGKRDFHLKLFSDFGKGVARLEKDAALTQISEKRFLNIPDANFHLRFDSGGNAPFHYLKRFVRHEFVSG